MSNKYFIQNILIVSLLISQNYTMAKGNNREGEGGAEAGNQKTVVLSVYLHCQECAKPIVKCLQDFQGVREVNTDFNAHTVIIKGSKEIDPEKLAERLKKKRNKLVAIISPTQKEMNAPEPKKSQPKIIRVILSIYIHCENCGKKMMQNIQKMAGVQSVEMNVKNLQMMVMGEFEPQQLVEYVDKRMGKQSSILKTETVSGGKQQQDGQQQQQQQDGQQQQQQQRGNKKNKNTSSEGHGDFYSPEELNFFYMSQIFSDENSQACTIM